MKPVTHILPSGKKEDILYKDNLLDSIRSLLADIDCKVIMPSINVGEDGTVSVELLLYFKPLKREKEIFDRDTRNNPHIHFTDIMNVRGSIPYQALLALKILPLSYPELHFYLKYTYEKFKFHTSWYKSKIHDVPDYSKFCVPKYELSVADREFLDRMEMVFRGEELPIKVLGMNANRTVYLMLFMSKKDVKGNTLFQVYDSLNTVHNLIITFPTGQSNTKIFIPGNITFRLTTLCMEKPQYVFWVTCIMRQQYYQDKMSLAANKEIQLLQDAIKDKPVKSINKELFTENDIINQQKTDSAHMDHYLKNYPGSCLTYQNLNKEEIHQLFDARHFCTDNDLKGVIVAGMCRKSGSRYVVYVLLYGDPKQPLPLSKYCPSNWNEFVSCKNARINNLPFFDTTAQILVDNATKLIKNFQLLDFDLFAIPYEQFKALNDIVKNETEMDALYEHEKASPKNVEGLSKSLF